MEDLFNQFESTGDTLLIVFFYTSSSGPCKLIDPKLDALEKKYNINLYKVDVSEDPSMEEEFQKILSDIPTFYFYKNRMKIDSFVGASISKIEEKILYHR